MVHVVLKICSVDGLAEKKVCPKVRRETTLRRAPSAAISRARPRRGRTAERASRPDPTPRTRPTANVCQRREIRRREIRHREARPHVLLPPFRAHRAAGPVVAARRTRAPRPGRVVARGARAVHLHPPVESPKRARPPRPPAGGPTFRPEMRWRTRTRRFARAHRMRATRPRRDTGLCPPRGERPPGRAQKKTRRGGHVGGARCGSPPSARPL